MSRKGVTYKLLFGEEEGERISKAQALAVKAGTALQNIIRQMSLEKAVYQAKLHDPTKDKILKADIVTQYKAIELKLGFEFDTKKAAKEVEDIQNFSHLMSIREERKIEPVICLFQAEDIKIFLDLKQIHLILNY